jgi:NAD(P)-dependent dehydrogenase (short-subunit alcohol dehydrogenase family)
MEINKTLTDEQYVVITGAGSGIGKAAALALAAKGYHIICISKSENAYITTLEIRQAGGMADGIVLDLSRYDEFPQDWYFGKSGRCAGVVLAAATLGPRGYYNHTPERYHLEAWQKTFKVNVLGNLFILNSVMPYMERDHYGRIIFFAGGGAAYPNPIFPAYSASKTANVRIAENLHEQLKDMGDFATVCLAPGAVETKMLEEVRNAGMYIKTFVDISEPVNFITNFIQCSKCNFSGRFVHVRDNWQDYLNNDKTLNENQWVLRRNE